MIITPVRHPRPRLILLKPSPAQPRRAQPSHMCASFTEPQPCPCHQKNWNLFAVNVVLAASSGFHLARKVNADYIGYGIDLK